MSVNDKLAATFGPGRTTPTPTLETRIAEVVAKALELDDDDGVFYTVAPCEHPAIIAAALAQMITEREADAYEKGHLDGDTHQYFDGMYPRNPNPYRSNDE